MQSIPRGFEQIIEGTPIALVELDLQRRYTWIHHSSFGLTPADVAGRNAFEVFEDPTEAARFDSMVAQVLETGRPVRGELPISLHSVSRYFDVSLNLLTDQAGAAVGVSGVVFEITERRRAEAALQEADRRKDEFIALLAHELRGPLAPTRNLVTLLMRDPELQAAQPRLAMVDRHIGHMARLIDDLLDVSRIENDTIPLRRRTFDLFKLLRNVVSASRLISQETGISITLDLPEGEALIHADPNRIGQVVTNLMSNARKFTPVDGHITVTAEAAAGMARFRVRDTGVGIPAEHLDRIFDRFRQFSVQDRPEFDGLGLGLYLSRRLVQMHEGSIEAHSDGLGRGSRFSVSLPLASEPDRSPAKSNQSDIVGHRLKVLVVDDSRDSADSLSLLLQAQGHEVNTAYDGLKGLAACERLQPHAVVMDIRMPRMDGFELAHRIRSEHWGRAMLLVALSGLGPSHDARSRQTDLIDVHMTKPADLDQLYRLLDERGQRLAGIS